MAEDNSDTLKEQEQDERKFDPVGFILAVILVGVIVIVAIDFLRPTIGNFYYPTTARPGTMNSNCVKKLSCDSCLDDVSGAWCQFCVSFCRKPENEIDCSDYFWSGIQCVESSDPWLISICCPP